LLLFAFWRDSAQQPAKNRNGIMQQNEVRDEYFKALSFLCEDFLDPSPPEKNKNFETKNLKRG
jgi:hypothetical protein